MLIKFIWKIKSVRIDDKMLKRENKKYRLGLVEWLKQ
jgi:hypothetical protein